DKPRMPHTMHFNPAVLPEEPLRILQDFNAISSQAAYDGYGTEVALPSDETPKVRTRAGRLCGRTGEVHVRCHEMIPLAIHIGRRVPRPRRYVSAASPAAVHSTSSIRVGSNLESHFTSLVDMV